MEQLGWVGRVGSFGGCLGSPVGFAPEFGSGGVGLEGMGSCLQGEGVFRLRSRGLTLYLVSCRVGKMRLDKSVSKDQTR